MRNQVILNKDQSTWPRIKKYWEDQGVDRMLIPTYGNEGTYYGLVNGIFGGFLLQQVKSNKAEIIELPENEEQLTTNSKVRAQINRLLSNWDNKEEKKYPRVMWVFDKGLKNKYKRVVLCEYGGKFIASDYFTDTLEEFFNELEFGSFVSWNYASEIEEPEMLIEEKPDKQEKKYPEYPKPILRKAFELICQLKTERLQRAGCSDMEVLTYINADKDLKEIESHLNK